MSKQRKRRPFFLPPKSYSNNSSHDETNPQTRGLCPP
nr:MAG TPA: hypothetical protein [Caudoviricetes sp.]